jgi:acetyl esterase/lipase
MMSFVLSIYGLVSAAIGILIGLPDRIEVLRPIQIAVNEIPLFPTLLGVIAALGGLMMRPRTWLAILSGSIGALLAARPLLSYRAASTDMHSAMRAGLGHDYEAQIPISAKVRLPQKTWSLRNVMGGIQRASETHRLDDIVYARCDGQDLKLNIYQPIVQAENSPALIVIHGGGWRNGEPGGWFAPHNRYFASQGYTVFDVEYRLSGVAKWPAQLDDVKAAIEWVKAHAGEYQVNPQRIALLGRSAGAHLALMAAYCRQSSIRSVVSIYGPTDLRWPDLEPDSAILELMGGTFEALPQAYENATPLNFVRDGLPPTLIIEGGMDTIVPYHHGDKLVGRLSLTDTVFVLLRVPWSRHGFDAVLSGMGAQLTYYHLDRFLAWSLRQ